ncbi:MAG: class A beta-lactamase-related serine hydrolase [Candidatus Syntrophonatronum acetioxidans]|uniref:Class A beta-lactamase-related serine hydrolase n=1 Tax=Candidatus Syntrophonatronum acetioxidans TaxID=1795816 RepID=A0A424YCT1_9FIRM|nr:MAG: class A beta-lactamase-related serine hydrolase [Candidatus Syntrophonatronum acetioxidans]
MIIPVNLGKDELAEYDFSPADIPFVKILKEGKRMKKRKISKFVLPVILVVVLVIVAIFVIQRMQWSKMDVAERLDFLTKNVVDNETVFGSLVKIESKDSTFKYENANGFMAIDDQFPLGSISKMFTSGIIYQLVDGGVVGLEDTLDFYLTDEEFDGLHYYDGTNNASSITIEQLLSQTTGLPDYFLEPVNGKSIFDDIVENDRFIEFEEKMERTKNLEPHFINGAPGKAYYSDINFDILEVIAERATGLTFEDILLDKITGPLELENTELATVESEYIPIYYNDETLEIPLALSSFRGAGGIISDLDDLMVFLRAFFEGEIFSESHLDRGEWKEIQFEYHEYKKGMMRFKLTGVWAVFGSYELIGHSGSNNTFAFYCPDKDVYIIGTLNQVTDPSVQYRLMTQLVGSIEN